MLISETAILEILFNLTLFFLLAFSVYRGIIEYLLPALYTEIGQLKKHKNDLIEKDRLLSASHIRLNKQVKSQARTLTSLEDKVQNWKTFLTQKKEKKERENEVYVATIAEKRKKQSKNLRLLKVKQIVIPKAIEESFEYMKKNYSGEEGLCLLHELIKKIEPKLSNR